MQRLLALMILLTVLAGCGQSDLLPSGAAPAARGGASVDIIDFAFAPVSLSVAMGTTITWTNTGARQHTSTSAGTWDSGAIEPGASFSRTFAAPGTFLYLCLFHSSMTGTITVSEGTPTNTPDGTPPTNTPTGTLTDTPTHTPRTPPTNTPTGTLTDTPTVTPTGSPTVTPTFTPIPPTPTLYDCRAGRIIPPAPINQAQITPTNTATPTVTPDCSYLPFIQRPPPPNTPTFTPTPTTGPRPPGRP